jgi:hypothetical protein
MNAIHIDMPRILSRVTDVAKTIRCRRLVESEESIRHLHPYVNEIVRVTIVSAHDGA